MPRYDAWGENGEYPCTCMSTPEGIADLQARDLMEPELKFVCSIFADTFEEAMDLYHKLNGWEPYIPIEVSMANQKKKNRKRK